METSGLLKTDKAESPIDREKFKRTLKTLEEDKLKDLRILIEMELMERDRRN